MKPVPLLALLLAPCIAFAGGTLGDYERITSDVLGYDLQYRVYVPDGDHNADMLDVLFVTDGPGYVRRGKMHRVLDRLIDGGDIRPVVTVFVDARDPDNLSNNRRNSQFLCNRDYLDFYERELIPAIEASYPVGHDRDHRGILGLSFGATNAACFGILGHETFSLIGMHSPANHPVRELLLAYEESPRLPLRMFLSTGQPNDNTQANRRFRRILEGREYDLKYIEVPEGHNWDNWAPLIDDVLLHFYATGDQDSSDL